MFVRQKVWGVVWKTWDLLGWLYKEGEKEGEEEGKESKEVC